MSRVIYYNNRMFFDEPLKLGPLLLYQIGEAYLEGHIPPSFHNQFCYEVTFVVSGSAQNLTNKQPCEISKGDILINCPCPSHAIEISKEHFCRFLFLAFDFDRSHPDYEFFRTMETFYRENNGSLVKDTCQLKNSFENLLEEMSTVEIMHTAMLYSGVTRILVQIYRLFMSINPYEKQVCLNEGIEGRIVYDVVHYIDNNYLKIDKLQEIAGTLGYSYSYLARVFSKNMGMSIGTYFKHRQFERAIQMMRENESLTLIAEHLGYSTVGAFSKAFSNHYKMAPSSYKKRFLSDSGSNN